MTSQTDQNLGPERGGRSTMADGLTAAPLDEPIELDTDNPATRCAILRAIVEEYGTIDLVSRPEGDPVYVLATQALPGELYYHEIAILLGVSRERTRQIEIEARGKIAHALRRVRRGIVDDLRELDEIRLDEDRFEGGVW